MGFLNSIKSYLIGAIMLLVGFMFWRTESQKNKIKDQLSATREEILKSNTKTIEEALKVTNESNDIEDKTRENIINSQDASDVKEEVDDIREQLEKSNGETIKITV